MCNNNRFSVFVIYYSMFTLGLYIASYQAILNLIVSSHNLNNIMGGTLIAAHFIGSFLMPLVLGEIADRIGKKIILFISTALFLIFILSIFFFNSTIVLFVSIFFIGGLFAVIEGIGSSQLSILRPDKVQSVMNISQMYFCFGCFFGPILVNLFKNSYYGWKSIYLIVSFALLILLILFGLLKNDMVIKLSIDNSLFTVKLIKLPFILLSAVCILIYVGIEEGYAFWIVTYIESINPIIKISSFSLSTYWLTMGIGRLISSRITSNHYRILIIGIIISLCSLLFIIIVPTGNTYILLIISGLTGFGFSAIWPILMANTIQAFPNYSATAAGLMMTCSAIGATVLPFIMGIIANAASIKSSFFSIFIALLLLFFLIFKLNKLSKKLGQVDSSVAR